MDYYKIKKVDLFSIIIVLIMMPQCFAENELEPLGENDGYVVLPFRISGLIPKSITIESKEVFGSSYTMKVPLEGEGFEIIRLPVGEYKWEKIRLYNKRYFDIEDNDFNISVRKDVVNYSGHLLININSRFGTANLNYVNRTSQIIAKLEKCCTDIIFKYPLVFTGNSNDPFIDFYKSEKGGR